MREIEKYRQNTPYEGVYKYVAPDNYHWECLGDFYGKIVWGGFTLPDYPYVLVKDNNYDENMGNNTDINNNINDTST